MTVTLFPRTIRLPIGDARDIAAIEELLSTLAGLITATGGYFAIGGRDVMETPLLERARILTTMYDAGEVVVGYADARNGDVVNLVIERLAVSVGAAEPAPCWRALVYVEEFEGHALRGSLAAWRWPALAGSLLRAVDGGLAEPLPSEVGALLALGHA